MEVVPEAPETLESILADDRLLDLFAKHLVKEFCVECLLSLIEMQQFKQLLMIKFDVGTEYGRIVEFAPNAPRSEIVYNGNFSDLQSAKGVAFAIYGKYVEEGAEFEINIRSRMRRKLHDKIGNHAVWMGSDVGAAELMLIFDEAMEENIKLLKQSKDRFHGNLQRMSTDFAE